MKLMKKKIDYLTETIRRNKFQTKKQFNSNQKQEKSKKYNSHVQRWPQTASEVNPLRVQIQRQAFWSCFSGYHQPPSHLQRPQKASSRSRHNNRLIKSCPETPSNRNGPKNQSIYKRRPQDSFHLYQTTQEKRAKKGPKIK